MTSWVEMIASMHERPISDVQFERDVGSLFHKRERERFQSIKATFFLLFLSSWRLVS